MLLLVDVVGVKATERAEYMMVIKKKKTER